MVWIRGVGGSRTRRRGLAVGRVESGMVEGFDGDEPMLIGVADLEGHLVSVSPACVEVLGWSAEEMKGLNWWEFIHPDDQPLLVEAVQEMPSNLGHEARTLGRDGRYRWIRWKLRAAAVDGRFSMTGRDVTGNRPADQVRVGLWEMRADAGMLTVSDSAAIVLTVGGAAVPLEALLERIHGSDRRRVGRALRWSLRSLEPYAEVFRILRPDGATGRVRMCGRGMTDGTATSHRIRGIVRDLTSAEL
jgi:PAS domain S-box-containing protein